MTISMDCVIVDGLLRALSEMVSEPLPRTHSIQLTTAPPRSPFIVLKSKHAWQQMRASCFSAYSTHHTRLQPTHRQWAFTLWEVERDECQKAAKSGSSAHRTLGQEVRPDNPSG